MILGKWSWRGAHLLGGHRHRAQGLSTQGCTAQAAGQAHIGLWFYEFTTQNTITIPLTRLGCGFLCQLAAQTEHTC